MTKEKYRYKLNDSGYVMYEMYHNKEWVTIRRCEVEELIYVAFKNKFK